jgi:hypothetical protein
MKKILTLILTLVMAACTFSLSADEVIYMKATSFSSRQYDYQYGFWHDWDDWEPCDVRIDINVTRDMVVVHSAKLQVYSIYSVVEQSNDQYGGKYVKYGVVDEDDSIGYMRLRLQSDGTAQIYFDFSNIMFVYTVIRL